MLTAVSEMTPATGALADAIREKVGMDPYPPGQVYVMADTDSRRDPMNRMVECLLRVKMGDKSIKDAITLVDHVKQEKGYNPQFPEFGDDMWLFPADSDLGVMILDLKIMLLEARVEELEAQS